MRYYNKLFYFNSITNSFEKADLRTLFREIQSTYIDSKYISSLCADTSANSILTTLMLTVLDSIKNSNSKINKIEKKLRFASKPAKD